MRIKNRRQSHSKIMIYLNILGWLVVFIYLGVLALLFLWAGRIFQKKVPFSPVPNNLLKEINEALALNDQSLVYDLGCRDGRTLFYFSKFNNKAKCFGIEDNLFSLIFFKTRLFFSKKNNIKIINKDFLSYNLNTATHIFIHLRPNIMDDLLPKFDRELKKGTKLISLYFHFTGKAPAREIILKNSNKNIIRKIYVYEF